MVLFTNVTLSFLISNAWDVYNARNTSKMYCQGRVLICLLKYDFNHS